MLTFNQLNAQKAVLSPNEKKCMCYVCDWFILMPPVFLNPARGFLCGFCYQDRKHFLENENSLLPQKLYDDIVIYVTFPCKYCEFFTIFNGPASMHEVQCSKRIFGCPLSNVNRWFLKEGENCDWQDDDGKSMVAHVREKHKEYILPSPFQINFEEIKLSKFKKHINIAILNNRKIISITTENDEETGCIVFRCKSNKFGHPDINYRCRIEFETNSDSTIWNNQKKINVFPLGARNIERSMDFCSVPVDSLHEDAVFQFSFSPPYELSNLPDPNIDDYDDEDFELFC